MERLARAALPDPLRHAIEARTGRIAAVRIAGAGQNSPLAAIITATGGRFFAKGMPSDHRRVGSQAREAAVAPLVRKISPALLALRRGQASRLPACQAADPASVDLFAAANVRLWAEVAQSSPAAWTTSMAKAAQSWSAYRQRRSRPRHPCAIVGHAGNPRRGSRRRGRRAR